MRDFVAAWDKVMTLDRFDLASSTTGGLWSDADQPASSEAGNDAPGDAGFSIEL